MKSKILNMLKANENKFLSSAEISEALNISRQAISKHMTQLKKQGHNIESVSRKGHRYVSAVEEIYNKAEIVSELDTDTLGKKMIFLETVDSTNNYAKNIALEHDDMTVVLADEQTAGKGRLGRQWASEKGSGIWMSIILKPDIEPAEAPKITQIAAAAMTEAIESVVGESIGIKWPNDIIYKKKKVCGVLTEMSAELGGINYVVVGIGVNVNQTQFPEELVDKAISLKMGLEREVSRKAIVLSFLKSFEVLYQDFITTNSLKRTIEICKSRSILLNETVRIITKAGTRTVKVIDINENGQLVIVNENGEREQVFYGEVSVRGLYEYID
ncbi:MAG: biotin--[acetyl-CoA-carboxylase] ligase [Clostridiales bacterium]|nr:biotin--[acetyl-CoA-carboxylase] ligase [Clostridiales bacterium]